MSGRDSACRSTVTWNAVAAVCLLGVTMASPAELSGAESVTASSVISVHAQASGGRFTSGDVVRLSVSLQNDSERTVYVDRRLVWGGHAGGLRIEIRDRHGKVVPSRMLADAMMPPPQPEDITLLVRLERGCFYGTHLELPVKETFPEPGRYSIIVGYKSWLRREHVGAQLRDVAAVWADAPEVVSNTVMIEVVRAM